MDIVVLKNLKNENRVLLPRGAAMLLFILRPEKLVAEHWFWLQELRGIGCKKQFLVTSSAKSWLQNTKIGYRNRK